MISGLQETYDETVSSMEKCFAVKKCFHNTTINKKSNGRCSHPHTPGELERAKKFLLRDLERYEKNESRKTVGKVHITFNKYNRWVNGFIGNKTK